MVVLKKDRNLTTFGVEVKKKLIEMRMTQKQLAQQIGTSDVYLNLILHGERSGNKYNCKIIKILKIE